MSDTLAISLVQYAPRWEDVRFNLSSLDRIIQPLTGKTNLVVLPEMFPTGFSMNVSQICSHSDEVLQWMQRQARSIGAIVAGSVAVQENTCYYNRFYWVSPHGDMRHYDKRHLFTMSGEPQYFTAGTEQKQFEWQGWKIKPVICYDLRFPTWCRNSRTEPYDLLVCSASWPSVRCDVWSTLLKARALENQCYVVGVNRIGVDEKGLQHQGDSVVYGPKGNIIGRLPENEEMAVTFDLSLSALLDFRRKFPVLDDMDDFSF